MAREWGVAGERVKEKFFAPLAFFGRYARAGFPYPVAES